MRKSFIKKKLEGIDGNFEPTLLKSWTHWNDALFAIINQQVQIQKGKFDNDTFSLNDLLNKALLIKNLNLTSYQFENIKSFIFLNLKVFHISNEDFKNLVADYLIYLKAKQGILNTSNDKHLPHNRLIDEIEKQTQIFIQNFEQEYEYRDFVLRLNFEDIVVAYALYQLLLIKKSNLDTNEKKDLACLIKQQMIEQGFTKPNRLYRYLHIAEEAIVWGLNIALMVTALLFLIAYVHMPYMFFNLIGATMMGVMVFAVGGYALADLKKDDIALAYQRIDALVEDIVAKQANSLVRTPSILVADEQPPNAIQSSIVLNEVDNINYVQQAKKLLGEVEVNKTQARPSTNGVTCQLR